MCGISFIVDKKGVLDDRPIKSMVESITHRGQDFRCTHKYTSRDFQVFFGANRLRVIDEDDNSNQPFFNQDRSAVLLFNGEIFNYFDLKNELINCNYQFRTHSDTEVLFYWLKEFGSLRLHELEGMFSFVYFDLKSNKFLCARDRFGIKPLYYFENDHFLILSSETRALLATNIFEKELNQNVIPHYLLYRYGPSPETFYQNVYQFPKGSFSESGTSEKLKFRNIEEEFFDTQIISVDTFKEALKESVLKQLNAKRGVGLMLSGGTDSSLIAALAKEEGVELPCFSIFTKENRTERQLAEDYAARYFLPHEVFEIDDSIINGFEEYIGHLDQPIADSAGLLTNELSKKVTPYLKVLLSGAGGDELFAGYNRHNAYSKYLKHTSQLLLLKKMMTPFLNPKRKQSVFFDFLKNLEQNPYQTFLNFASLHFSTLRAELNFSDKIGQNEDPFLWALEHDRNNYLVNDVLAISDVTSMSAGVEVRVPFLDNDLVRRVRMADPYYLISKGPKWILKEILSAYTYKKHLNLPKTGFGLPLKNWLRMEHHRHLYDLFQNKNSVIFNFLDRNFIHQLIQSHQNQQQDNTQVLWSVLTLSHWLKKEFG